MSITMVAISASFVTPRRPVAAAAFGGLIDLWRIFFRSGRSMPVVCSACQTINRYSVTVCKGCAGKLPAFYTAAGSGVGDVPSSGTMGARALVARSAQALAVPARWVTVAWVAIALIALFSAFGLWYAMYSSAAGRPAPVQASLLAVAPATAPSVAPNAPPAVHPGLAADVSRVAESQTATIADVPVEVPSRAAPQPVRAPAQVRTDLQQRRASLPPAEPRAASVRRVGTSPVAMCSGLPIIAHAVCTNNHCAQPANARHPQCADALRQRRLDEARRNPTLFN